MRASNHVCVCQTGSVDVAHLVRTVSIITIYSCFDLVIAHGLQNDTTALNLIMIDNYCL